MAEAVLRLARNSKGWFAASDLLERSDLLIADLDNRGVELWGAHKAAELTGVVGLEVLSDIGMLRSLAIAQGARGQGLGTRLCEHIIQRACAIDLRHLYLLTETAAVFFARLGFAEIPRGNAPADVAASAQFSQLCPASATFMAMGLPAATQ